MAWKNPTSFDEAETALDGGKLYGAAGGKKYWLARRNGKTKRWKKSPGIARIPIKMGLRMTAAIELFSQFDHLRIADSREEAEGPNEV
jgi:hypothetical protein